ncbi:Mgm101 protein [Martiniozyma asiatica (nom. inval.)]|nr:Mgm101 protein [Martiniozyma asiatica]
MLCRLRPVLHQARVRTISTADMLEAFGQSSSNGNSTEKKITKSGGGGGGTDPVININTDRSITKTVEGFSTLNDKVNLDISASNWSLSFHGLGASAFSKESQAILSAPLEDNDIEITPDGLLYLPEIKYRRILNKSFGAGGWGLAPRSETLIQQQGMGGLLTREYGLVVEGRLVGTARGEQTFFNEKGIPTAAEGCKSNALMRCCKDLGIASELWDPRFIKAFKKKWCENIFVEYVPTKKKKKIWKRKDDDVDYPFKR